MIPWLLEMCGRWTLFCIALLFLGASLGMAWVWWYQVLAIEITNLFTDMLAVAIPGLTAFLFLVCLVFFAAFLTTYEDKEKVLTHEDFFSRNARKFKQSISASWREPPRVKNNKEES